MGAVSAFTIGNCLYQPIITIEVCLEHLLLLNRISAAYIYISENKNKILRA